MGWAWANPIHGREKYVNRWSTMHVCQYSNVMLLVSINFTFQLKTSTYINKTQQTKLSFSQISLIRLFYTHVHTCTHMYTHTHAHTHARTHTHTHTHRLPHYKYKTLVVESQWYTHSTIQFGQQNFSTYKSSNYKH